MKSVANISPREPYVAQSASNDALLKEIYAQNWENARHLRNVRVLGANVFAIVVASCLATLQFVRDDPLGQVTLLGFLVVASVIQLLMSIELKNELDECMRRIDLIVGDSEIRRYVALLVTANGRGALMRLRWLYPAFYLVTAVALGIAFVRAVLPLL